MRLTEFKQRYYVYYDYDNDIISLMRKDKIGIIYDCDGQTILEFDMKEKRILDFDENYLEEFLWNFNNLNWYEEDRKLIEDDEKEKECY